MMTVLAGQPTDLDKLLNECVALSIRRFASKMRELPVGMQPVMIGRRLPRYDTVDKVMNRLTRVYEILYYMERLQLDLVNIH